MSTSNAVAASLLRHLALVVSDFETVSLENFEMMCSIYYTSILCDSKSVCIRISRFILVLDVL